MHGTAKKAEEDSRRCPKTFVNQSDMKKIWGKEGIVLQLVTTAGVTDNVSRGYRGFIVRDRLRLRGIDCPETGTPGGDRAKRFVEKLLPASPAGGPAGATVVIKSHKWKTDIHGRFVVDVFYKEGVDDPEAIIKDGTYLNQELIDKGYAVRMAE